MAATIGTETLFALLLSCFVFFFLKSTQTRLTHHLLLSALFLALSALCRPISLYLFVGYPLFLMVARDEPWSRVKWIPVMGLLLCGPWFLRNSVVFGTGFYSSVSSINLLFHTAAGVLAKENKSSRYAEEQHMRTHLLGDLNFQQPEAIPIFQHRADSVFMSVAKKYPATFAALWAKGFVYFFVKPMRSYIDQQIGFNTQFQPAAPVGAPYSAILTAPWWQSSSKITLAAVGIQVIWLAGVVLGLCLILIRLRPTESTLIFLLGLLLYFACISALTETDARLRMPIHGILVILAAMGWSQKFSLKNKNP
jgi:hypothetical protein